MVLLTVFLLTSGVVLTSGGFRFLQRKRVLREASPVTLPGELSSAELEALVSFGRQVSANRSELWDDAALQTCAPHLYGVGYGSHWFCAPTTAQLESGCFYINYGIELDWSLDTSLSHLGCRGLALDPTVAHRSELEPNVLFFKLAAPTLPSDSVPTDWQVMSLPRLWGLHGKRDVYAVKYDCEGCEFALTRSGAEHAQQRAEMLELFHHTTQLNIELHLVRKFLNTAEKLHNLAAFLLMLTESGLYLVRVDNGGCGAQVPEDRDCVSELYDAGIPCATHNDCSSYLFARPAHHASR